jgi:GntR family transcriptional regulator
MATSRPLLRTSEEMRVKKVDKHVPIPLYYQLKTIIRRKIEAKEWNASDRIPSESYLSKYHEISPMTVRQAVNELCDDGLLYKVRGRGTFVSKPRVERDLSELTSLSEKLKESGYDINRKVLNIRTAIADKRVAESLEIQKGDRVIELERLMLFEDTPFYHEMNVLPCDPCEAILTEDFAENSIYRILENKLGMKLDHAHTTIEAISSRDYESKLLKIRKGSPLLRLRQISFLKHNRPIHSLEATARSDIYKYTLVRRRKR